jgi:hypothetical protein
MRLATRIALIILCLAVMAGATLISEQWNEAAQFMDAQR